MPHALDSLVRTQFAVSAIRGTAAAPLTEHSAAVVDSISAAARAAATDALLRPPARPVRDGARRPAALAALDDHHRISLRAVAGALGWDKSTQLVATVEDGRGVIRAGLRARPSQTKVRPLDSGLRLTLPPSLAAALDVEAGEQVLAVAVLAAGELHLHAAADVLQSLTGPVAAPGAPEATVTPLRSRRSTQVLAAFQAD